MRVEDVIPGMNVYHNKPDGYYSTEKVLRVEGSEVVFSGGGSAVLSEIEPKPDRGEIKGKTASKKLTEGFHVFDPQENEVFLYCHKLDHPRAGRLLPATPKQSDSLKVSGKCIVKF